MAWNGAWWAGAIGGAMWLLTSCGEEESGATTCTGHDVQGGTEGCHITLDHCEDAHVYSLTCAGDKCSCTVDGKAESTPSGNSCPADSAGLNTACGWDLK